MLNIPKRIPITETMIVIVVFPLPLDAESTILPAEDPKKVYRIVPGSIAKHANE